MSERIFEMGAESPEQKTLQLARERGRADAEKYLQGISAKSWTGRGMPRGTRPVPTMFESKAQLRQANDKLTCLAYEHFLEARRDLGLDKNKDLSHYEKMMLEYALAFESRCQQGDPPVEA